MKTFIDSWGFEIEVDLKDNQISNFCSFPCCFWIWVGFLKVQMLATDHMLFTVEENKTI